MHVFTPSIADNTSIIRTLLLFNCPKSFSFFSPYWRLQYNSTAPTIAFVLSSKCTHSPIHIHPLLSLLKPLYPIIDRSVSFFVSVIACAPNFSPFILEHSQHTIQNTFSVLPYLFVLEVGRGCVLWTRSYTWCRHVPKRCRIE
eukprot:1120452_1